MNDARAENRGAEFLLDNFIRFNIKSLLEHSKSLLRAQRFRPLLENRKQRRADLPSERLKRHA